MKITPETLTDIITHDTQTDIKEGKVEIVIPALTHEEIAKHFDFKAEGDQPYRAVIYNYEIRIYNAYNHTTVYLPNNKGSFRMDYRKVKKL